MQLKIAGAYFKTMVMASKKFQITAKNKYLNMKNTGINIKTVFLVLLGVILFNACDKDDDLGFEKTRLFRPVLNEDLYSIGNAIVVDMAKLKAANSYTLEVSRDTFRNVEYTIVVDTNFVEINRDLIGEELFWNTLYQVRATAHAADPQFDSKAADLGNVRTQRFPTILNVPASFDVIDNAARVTWTLAGAPVTEIRVYAGDDLRLDNSLFEVPVSEEEQQAGEIIIDGLEPSTEYQVAIYSGDELRGWVKYTTKVQDIDPTAPGVIDIREDESPGAVSNAVASAPDGAIILVKRGVAYDFPQDNLDKSITIRAAYGFGEQKATLYTTGNWDIADGSNIGHIRFVGLELRGEDYTGDYVFNPNRSDIYVGEISFEDTKITNFRGVMRIRGTIEVNEFIISNSVVDSIGSYGILTTDTNPSDPPTARVNNIKLVNSTFNKIQAGITSRNNSQSILIENSTFANFIQSGNYIFRYRGGEGNDNVTNGIEIRNSIFGHGWDEAEGGENWSIRGMQGLENTTFNIVNVYSTSDFEFSGNEIPGFPVGNYSGTQQQLWVSPPENNFNFRDNGFSGRFDTGDPRWRARL